MTLSSANNTPLESAKIDNPSRPSGRLFSVHRSSQTGGFPNLAILPISVQRPENPASNKKKATQMSKNQHTRTLLSWLATREGAAFNETAADVVAGIRAFATQSDQAQTDWVQLQRRLVSAAPKWDTRVFQNQTVGGMMRCVAREIRFAATRTAAAAA
jgi:dihydroorotase-like cyclic amidohydrolase